MESLRGQLLISSGGLFDPHFHHTVVLIGEHNSDGALGVVLNRALDVTVADAVPELWSRVLQRKGSEYRRLSRMPFDPSVN